ncbi:MAG: class I SAM-dependent methyltransferase [Promethearchaeota archaeon]
MESLIREKEDHLRAWFVKNSAPIQQIIDGLDIGWGGSARWTTAKMSIKVEDVSSLRILDVACGYGTFLAELGWRFPSADLFGLNLDFKGPHNIIFDLLDQADVNAKLIQADAVNLPILSQSFDFITCFLGLQDIEITRSQQGIIVALNEMLRVVQPNGYVVLLDKYPFSSLLKWMSSISYSNEVVVVDTVVVDCRWDREIGEIAVDLYSKGTLQQLMNQATPPTDPQATLKEIQRRMRVDLEQQLTQQGYYNPWGRMTLVMVQRTLHKE